MPGIGAAGQRFRHVRIDRQRAIVTLKRLVHLTHGAQHTGAIDIGTGMVGFFAQHAVEFGQSARSLPHRFQRQAAIVARFDIIGFQHQRAVIAFQRRFGPVQRHQDQSAIVPGIGIGGVQRHRLIEIG